MKLRSVMVEQSHIGAWGKGKKISRSWILFHLNVEFFVHPRLLTGGRVVTETRFGDQ